MVERIAQAVLFFMIHTRLDFLMNQNNLTNTALADVIGVSDVTIGFWRKGRKEPNSSKLQLIAKYFGVSADYLLGIDDPVLSPDRHKLIELANTLTDEQVNALLAIADTWNQ